MDPDPEEGSLEEMQDIETDDSSFRDVDEWDVGDLRPQVKKKCGGHRTVAAVFGVLAAVVVVFVLAVAFVKTRSPEAFPTQAPVPTTESPPNTTAPATDAPMTKIPLAPLTTPSPTSDTSAPRPTLVPSTASPPSPTSDTSAPRPTLVPSTASPSPGQELFCKDGDVLDHKYLHGIHPEAPEPTSFSQAWASCVALDWTCTGVTCTVDGHCTARTGSAYVSTLGEKSCVQTGGTTTARGECVRWVQHESCESEAVAKAPNGCEERIQPRTRGHCVCGGGELLEVRCEFESRWSTSCKDLCASPDVDECSVISPCATKASCHDPDRVLGNIQCSCPDGFAGPPGINRQPSACRPLYVQVHSPDGCPAAVFPLTTAGECEKAAKVLGLHYYKFWTPPESPGIALGTAGGCQHFTTNLMWAPLTADEDVVEPPADYSEPVQTSYLCATRELAGGFKPPAADWAPSPDEQQAAVVDMLYRILDVWSADRFSVVIQPTFQPDTCTVNATTETTLVTGSTGVAASRCIYTYLKHNGVSISSGRDAFDSFPSENPTDWTVEAFELTSRVPYKHAFNPVTFSYSMAWWDFKRWEREIDWLALRGVNLPLAFTGQEKVWMEVYTDVGLTEDDVLTHFAGPAFLAWSRNGKAEHWMGPITIDFIESQHELQKKILARMRSFGMQPVLPAFAGHVPTALLFRHPKASFAKGQPWEDFEAPLFLAGDDPLFARIATAFVQAQRKAYGWSAHFYSADSNGGWGETQRAPGYIEAAAAALYSAVKKGDPYGKLLVQGSMFEDDWWRADNYNAMNEYLRGLPTSDVLVIDVASDIDPLAAKTSGFKGHPYVLGLLHNFGGRSGMYGNLDLYKQQAQAALGSGHAVVGLGITMEAPGQNPIVYDFYLDLAWTGTGAEEDTDAWIDEWVASRYAVATDHAVIKVWRVFVNEFYNGEVEQHTDKWMLLSRPKLFESCVGGIVSSSVLVAWQEFVDFSDLQHIVNWRRDVAAITNIIMQSFFCRQLEAINQRLKSDWLDVEDVLDLMDEVVAKIETVLATDENTQLGCWIDDAEQWAQSTDEARALRWNMAVQVTTWSFPDSQLQDYAKKAWAGLTEKYYAKRWQLYAQFLRSKAGSSGEMLDQMELNGELRTFERGWLKGELPDFSCSDDGDILKFLKQELG